MDAWSLLWSQLCTRLSIAEFTEWPVTESPNWWLLRVAKVSCLLAGYCFWAVGHNFRCLTTSRTGNCLTEPSHKMKEVAQLPYEEMLREQRTQTPRSQSRKSTFKSSLQLFAQCKVRAGKAPTFQRAIWSTWIKIQQCSSRLVSLGWSSLPHVH